MPVEKYNDRFERQCAETTLDDQPGVSVGLKQSNALTDVKGLYVRNVEPLKVNPLVVRITIQNSTHMRRMPMPLLTYMLMT